MAEFIEQVLDQFERGVLTFEQAEAILFTLFGGQPATEQTEED